MIQNKSVAIIGGGPGGLTLAKLLQLRGVNVKVYERDADEHARWQGATLDLHEESGLRALEQCGLIDAFSAAYRPDAGLVRILDGNAVVQYDEHGVHDSLSASRPEIDRGPLRDILLRSLDAGTVVWNSKFMGMSRVGDRWQMTFAHGLVEWADIVIGADGAKSLVRPLLTDIKAIYSGITVVEGNIADAAQRAPEMWKAAQGGKIFALHNSQSVILSAKGDGTLSFYTGCVVPENWVKKVGIDFTDGNAVAAWFSAAFSTWSHTWQELVNAAGVNYVPRPQYHFPIDQRWHSQPHLTLLGDAAHRMPPYAGEGVNMAMQDALELADCLTSVQYAATADAIAAYEEGMWKRAGQITAMTLEQTALLHAPDALQYLVSIFNGFRAQHPAAE